MNSSKPVPEHRAVSLFALKLYYMGAIIQSGGCFSSADDLSLSRPELQELVFNYEN